MKTLEIRRHSLTKKGDERGSGSHLSAEGVRLAREVGNDIGPFAYVAVSIVPRTMETAIAMGFAPNDAFDHGGGPLWEAANDEVGHHEWWDWENPFITYREKIEAAGAVRNLAQRQVDLWTDALSNVSDGEAALFVTHGSLIESGLVCAMPDGDHENWGRAFHQLEGARLSFDQRRFTLVELLRRNQD